MFLRLPPKRPAHDAVAEVRLLASNSYEWVLEGDIEACLDNIDHTAPGWGPSLVTSGDFEMAIDIPGCSRFGGARTGSGDEAEN